MDSSQEAANLANIETRRLTSKLVNIGYATLIVCAIGTVFAAWAVLHSPDTSNAPPAGGGFMVTKWLPVILLGTSSLIVASALFVVALRQWKYKQFAQQIFNLTEGLKSEMEKATQARADAKQVRADLKNADLRANEEKNSKDSILELYRESERKLAGWAWLTQMPDDQKIAIDNHVVLEKLTLEGMNLTTSVPSVRLGIYVMNKSVLAISLNHERNAEVNGKIRFEDELENIELTRPKHVVNTVKDLLSCGTGCLTIEQLLTPEQASVINNAHGSMRARFNFDELIVNISGGNHSPDITPRPLILKKAFLTVYPVNRCNATKRIAALSHALGRGIQLYEPLRKNTDCIPIAEFENWKSGAIAVLEKAYGDADGNRVFHEISHGDGFPATSSGQTAWFHLAFAILEDLISRQIKEDSEQ